MAETTVVAINYEESDSIEIQGKRDKIQKYLDKGYHVKLHRNGYWVLIKPAQVNVTLSNGETTNTFDMKEDVCDYYNRSRISDKLYEKFKKDANAGKITFSLDEEGCYSFN